MLSPVDTLTLALAPDGWGLVIGAVIAGLVLSLLYIFSAGIRDFARMQVLREEIAALRKVHAERLRQLQEQAELAPLPDGALEEGEFEIVDPPSATRKAA